MWLVMAALAMGTGQAAAQDLRACKAFGDGPGDISCVTLTGAVETPAQPNIHSIGEGVVRAPGSELAYLVVANYDTVPVSVAVRFLVSGVGLVSRQVDVPALSRAAYEVHNDDAFGPGLRTFSTRVYAPGSNIDVSLVMRPLVNPWSQAVLPPLAVQR